MEQNLFLPVYEQQDKFCFVIKKDVQGKNKVIHYLSSCIIKKFNGDNVTKAEIKSDEKTLQEPIETTMGDDVVNDKKCL